LDMWSFCCRHRKEEDGGAALAPQPARVAHHFPLLDPIADLHVIELRLSDHAPITFFTPEGPVLSQNCMCTGERYNPQAANSFGVDPNDEKRWRGRLSSLVRQLQTNVTVAEGHTNALPIIALQEFPRVKQTGASFFEQELQLQFPGWKFCFGAKDSHGDQSSQLCVLVPPKCNIRAKPDMSELTAALPRQHRDNLAENPQWRRGRFQVVVFDNHALINIHPGPSGRFRGNDDPVLHLLDTMSAALLQTVAAVHVVGDWNRPAKGVVPPVLSELRWDVSSPNGECHLAPFSATGGQTIYNKGGPIDHLVRMTRR